MSMRQCKILESWKEFEQIIKTIKEETERTRVLYRGQANVKWPLDTTLERKKEGVTFDGYLKALEELLNEIAGTSNKNWGKLIDQVSYLRKTGLESILMFPTKEKNTTEIISFMTYLRHHGFASPLLDWTRDPYVAAFFAFHNLDRDVTNVAIYTFREYTEYSGEARKTTDPQIIGIGHNIIGTSDRHEKQKTQYTICTKLLCQGNHSLSNYIFTNHESAINQPGFYSDENGQDVDVDYARNVVTKYIIPVSERKRVLEILQEKQINKRSLFEATLDNLLDDLWDQLVVEGKI